MGDPSDVLVFLNVLRGISGNLEAIRSILEKKTPSHSNDDEDLPEPSSSSRPGYPATQNEVPAPTPMSVHEADAVRYVVSLEPIFKKSIQGTYDWKTANRAAGIFLMNRSFSFAQAMRDWALRQSKFQSRLIVSPIMFEFLESEFDKTLIRG